MSTDIYQARKTIQREKQKGTLINACGTDKAQTAIFIDNGSVVSSPLSINVLMNAIERANYLTKPIRRRVTEKALKKEKPKSLEIDLYGYEEEEEKEKEYQEEDFEYDEEDE
jgi:hypothetical protein